MVDSRLRAQSNFVKGRLPVTFAAFTLVIGSLTCSSSRAANQPDYFRTGSSLGTGAAWSTGSLPSFGYDAAFDATSPMNSLSLNGASLSVGSLVNIHTGVTTTITNEPTATGLPTSTIFLADANSVTGFSGTATTDLIYVASGASTVLNLNGGTNAALNLTLGRTGSFNVGTNSTLNIGVGGVASTLDLGNYQLTINSAGTTNIGNASGVGGSTITGSAGLSKTGAGTLTLSGGHAFTGAVSIGVGIVNANRLANGNASSSVGASSNVASNLLLSNATTLNYTGAATDTDRLFTINGTAGGDTANISASGTGAVRFTNTGAIAYGLNNQTRTLTLAGTNTGNNTLAAAIGNNGTAAVSVIKSGAGTWVLPNANGYSGGTTLSAGVLSIGDDNALGSGKLTVTSATIRSMDTTAHTLPNAFAAIGSGAAVVNFGSPTETTGDLTFSNPAQADITGSATRSFQVYTTTTFAGGILGDSTLTLTKSGTGTLVINGPSTFGKTSPGGLQIPFDGGAVRLGNNTAAGLGSVTVGGDGAQTGTLQFSNGITVANTINLSGARNDPYASTSPGVAHLQNISGNNTVSTGGFAIPSSGTGIGVLFRSDSGTLTINGGLSGTAGGTSRREYHVYGAGNGVLNGVISDGSTTVANGGTRVVKDGTGTWTLNGANVYKGQTVIRGGTLRADAVRIGTPTATSSSATGIGLVNVNSGGTLAGNGGTGGVIVNPGGFITAGTGSSADDSVGTLSTGDQTWAGGGTYVFKIAATTDATTAAGQTAGAGVYWDRLNMVNLSLSPASAPVTSSSPFIIKIVGLNPQMSFVTGAKFLIANIAGTSKPTAQDFTNLFTLDTRSLGIANSEFNLSTASGSSSSTNVFLNFNGDSTESAPEPTTAALFGLGGIACLGRRRRTVTTGA